MVKILLKTAVLVFIILSIYFIVNPSACSNFLMGRVTNVTDTQVAATAAGDHGELFMPSGDKPLRQDGPSNREEDARAPEEENAQPEAEVSGITDTNTLTQEQAQPPLTSYSQDDIDYAIASRYVELENEYAKLGKTGKDIAKEISYTVMDDFEMTQSEWESFLERATASNLFNKVRKELEQEK